MAVELIPSVLATTKTQLHRRADLAQRLAPIIHLDVMDGRFVKTKSVGASLLAKNPWKRKVEIHAMVKNPAMLLPVLNTIKPRRVYLHIELGRSLLPMIALLRSRNIELGLALNPSSLITSLQPYIRYAKSVLVLSVHPGRYQAPIWHGAFNRIRNLHRRWPRLVIACDGSMNQTTLPRAIKAGARRIIVGSDVMLSVDPQAEWKKLQALTK